MDKGKSLRFIEGYRDNLGGKVDERKAEGVVKGFERFTCQGCDIGQKDKDCTEKWLEIDKALCPAEVAVLGQAIEEAGLLKPEGLPKIVCLCGSVRFVEAYKHVTLVETLAGNIVLSIGCNLKIDAEFDTYTDEHLEKIKTKLDELHLRKIDLADEVFILNVGGYIGDSTKSELAYAKAHGKPIRWLEPDKVEEAFELREKPKVIHCTKADGYPNDFLYLEKEPKEPQPTICSGCEYRHHCTKDPQKPDYCPKPEVKP